MTLSLCRKMVGHDSLIEETPAISNYHDALYVPPNWPGSSPGLYDRTRKILPGGGHVVGVPHLHYAVGEPFTHINPTDFDFAPDDDYLFVGLMSAVHYGHFLVGALARFWFLNTLEPPWPKFVYLDSQPPEQLFASEFAASLAEAMGLRACNFIRFETPTRFRHLRVPAASFEENNCVYRLYAKFCNSLGDIVAPSENILASSKPVYLSKHKLARGVSHIVNELELCEELDRRGVDIISPELMTLSEQIALFRERPLVTGCIGSALHTSIFTPRCRMAILNNAEEVWSNQILVDKANNNNSVYVYPIHGLVNAGTDAHFGNNFVLDNPKMIGSEYYQVIESCMETVTTDVRNPHASNGNVALGKPTMQSSRDGEAERSQVRLPDFGAVSGIVTGGYQFHTSCEQDPWWQVDLGRRHKINSIVIYNRLGDTASRSSRLVGRHSVDGITWREAFSRKESEPFGGIDGKPFVWTSLAPIRARFVRLQIAGYENFHLDQVKIFGVSE